MTLLPTGQDPTFHRLVDEVFSRQLEQDERLRGELDERAKRKMYQDAAYNVSYLRTALELEDDNLYADYARWLYQLLCPLMPYCTRERVRDVMVDHYELVRSCMEETVREPDRARLNLLLDGAVRATVDECECPTPPAPAKEAYRAERERYLDSLLKADARSAAALVSEYLQNGVPVNDLYVDIVGEAMRQVGELWHEHAISVDMEHAGTSITQLALSQLYPLVFEQERKGRTIVVACVGSELHEVGARMVADMFEYDGWDSVYLGPDVAVETIEDAIERHRPQLVALSVTMPQHLPLCRVAAARLHAGHPEVKIAVGGHAFASTSAWRTWDVDVCTQDARELLAWAEETLE